MIGAGSVFSLSVEAVSGIVFDVVSEFDKEGQSRESGDVS